MTTAPPSEGLVDRLADAVRERILTGAIPAGSQLRQAELAAEFEVSRTPIREALRQLQASGLVDVVPNRGAVVRIPSPWEVRHAYEVRAEVEALACAHAADRIGERELAVLRESNDVLRSHVHSVDAHGMTERRTANDLFHSTIITLGGNPWVATVAAHIEQSFPQYVASVALPGQDRQHEQSVAEHDAVVEALVARDATRAREAMRAHVLANGEQLAWLYEAATAHVAG
ncbi:GntR family transcriptional regulator [Cellulomonas citrea]|uniref:GntR family transcriptional regulator n=1 Tax=Cellulomonas citrea TaxID=1909423 RepID=UPI00135A06F6|nr:GntR family transcriptional regulator [Cellulomonas citrea]